MKRSLYAVLPAILVALIPLTASAQALTQATSLFNIFVGLMLTASLLAYMTSFIVWVVRLGNYPSYRSAAINIGEWGVIILFTLLVILTVVQFFRDHPNAAAATTGTIIFIAAVFAILYFTLFKKEDEKKKK